MQSSELHKTALTVNSGNFILVLISLAALTATFVVSNSSLTFSAKLTIFIAIIAIYVICGAAFYFRQNRRVYDEPQSLESAAVFDDEVEAKLFALEEAHQFFGASLKYADMFRLVASRLNDIVPFATCVLFVANDEKSTLNSQFAIGINMREFTDVKIRNGSGLAGKSFQNGTAEITENLTEDGKLISAKALNGLQSGIAVPLFKDAEIFGVLVLYGSEKNQFNQNSSELLVAAAERVAPLFLSSQAFENNLANALTDSLTELPNERAFYLVLENQIAEAQRYRGERPLTVLTIDVRNFDEVNQNFGHATGNLLLEFAAETIKGQLRQMDFLARSTGDEFLAVLPTASEAITREIIERIRKTFVLKPFKISPNETVYLELNFGASSFLKDGETAAALVKHAILKRRQSKKDSEENKILFFPKDFVN